MTAAPPVWRVVKRTYGDGEVTYMVQNARPSSLVWTDDGAFYTEGEARYYVDRQRGRAAARAFTDEVLT